MALLFWMMDGLVAGWLTESVMSSERRDQIMDIGMGIAGAVAGGLIFNAFHLLVRGQMIYINLAALMGAITLTVLARYLGGRREFSTTD